MTTRTCAQCGHPLPDQGKFCGQCGASTAPAARSPASPTLLMAPRPSPASPSVGPSNGSSQAPSPPRPSYPSPPRPASTATVVLASQAAPALAEPPPTVRRPEMADLPSKPPTDATIPILTRAEATGGVTGGSRPVVDTPPSAASVQTVVGYRKAAATIQTSPEPGPVAPVDRSTPPAPPPIAHASAAPAPPPGAGSIAPGAVIPQAPRSSGRSLQQTMLGMAQLDAVAPAILESHPPPQAPKPAHNKTMLGIARPGIAPTRPGEADDPPVPVATAFIGTAPVSLPPVANGPIGANTQPIPAQRWQVPSQAPSPGPSQAPRQAPGLGSTIAIIPAPPPLVDMPAPAAPRIVRRRGWPLAAVALTTCLLVLGAGLAIMYFSKNAPPITAQPRVSLDGKDILHLRCDPQSCKDGTTVELDGAKSTFASGESDLPLTKSLRVGDNALVLHIDRPGYGRDEQIKLGVPVAYRVRADVAPMRSAHPSIQILVEAAPGTDVKIAGKPVPLDANGSGAYTVDETAATDGQADQSRVVAVDVPYVVTPKGRAAESGTVSARVVVAPLWVDAPGTHGVVDEDRVLVAGRAAKGATVTIDGSAVTVGPEGAFEATIALDAVGEKTIDVRGGTATLTPRTVHVSVTRVASLAEQAKAFEQQKPVGYDAAMSDIAASTGQAIVVDGDVIEARASGHRTLLLMDDRRGCQKGPCLTRVILGRDMTIARGDKARAYGRVARSFTTTTGQTVPEIEADFVIPARPARGS